MASIVFAALIVISGAPPYAFPVVPVPVPRFMERSTLITVSSAISALTPEQVENSVKILSSCPVIQELSRKSGTSAGTSRSGRGEAPLRAQPLGAR